MARIGSRIGTGPIREPLSSPDPQPWHNYGQPHRRLRSSVPQVEISQPPEPEFNQVIQGDYRPWNISTPEPEYSPVIEGAYRPAWEAVWGAEDESFQDIFLSGFTQWFNNLRSNK